MAALSVFALDLQPDVAILCPRCIEIKSRAVRGCITSETKSIHCIRPDIVSCPSGWMRLIILFVLILSTQSFSLGRGAIEVSPERRSTNAFHSNRQVALNRKFAPSSRLRTTQLTLQLPSFTETDTRRMTASASLIVFMDILVRRLFNKLGIAFPSSLGGCGMLLVTMLTLPIGDVLFKGLQPGATLLAKWLPLFFVPSLIMLPLADSVGPWSDVVKIGTVIVGGLFFTLLTTAWSVIGIRKVTNTPDFTPEQSESTVEAKPSPKPFSVESRNFLLLSMVTTWIASMFSPVQWTKQASKLLLFFTTLGSFVIGARLPASFTRIVHPLVTCTFMTWATMGAMSGVSHVPFLEVLQTYRKGTLAFGVCGPGDLLQFMLGPAVVSLAVSMYARRKLMKENIAEVGTAIGVSTLGGVFGTALAVRLLKLGSTKLRLSLLSRNITSPLAMSIAEMLGADVPVAVSFVVITGLIGANFGAMILNLCRVKDPVARGLGIGAAAHGLGTAAFTNEKDAFPFAAIAMALTASAATVLVSIPHMQKLVLKVALG